MKRTVYIPADLVRHVEAYLARRPGVPSSTLMLEGARSMVRLANPCEILRLAGLAAKAPKSQSVPE